MAWEWSHTNEAYHIAREKLGRKSMKFLIEAYAEAQAYMDAKYADPDSVDPFDLDKYEEEEKRVKDGIRRGQITKEALADAVWDFACDLSTCDNGGFNAWMCPYGCHTVPFS